MDSKAIYQMHYDTLVIDSHSDFLDKAYDSNLSFGDVSPDLQSGIFKLRDGGVDVQCFAVFIKPENERDKSPRHYAVEQILILNKFETEFKAFFEIGKKLKDIGRIVSEKKVCGLIGIEGGDAIEDNYNNLGEYYELGVRYITLTWNNSNNIGISAKDEFDKQEKGNLTKFGKQLIKEMNNQGMIIDVSHLGEGSFWDVIDISEHPIIASHSNCYSIYPHFRNLKDDQIKAIADKGGVVNVNFHSGFLTHPKKSNFTALDVYKEKLSGLQKEANGDLIKFNILKDKFFEESILPETVLINNVVEHIVYLKNLVGADHIGLGSDFDGGITPPFDLYDSSCYPTLTRKLFEKGFTENELKKILGLNFLRVFYTVCK